MKKHSKLVVLILSLALLTGLVFGITAMAQDTESGDAKLTVISQNVSYSEKMYLYYAVYPENVNTEGLVLKVYSEDPDKNTDAELLATVSESTGVTITDTDANTSYDCRAFETPGVALKNLATTFYVQAVAADGTESAVKRYSVVEYLYQKMLETDDSAKRAAYGKLLAAGDAAQLLLGYYPNGTSDIPTNYNYVKVTDGTLSDGYSRGVYLSGTEITLSYNNGTDSSMTGWTVTDLESGDTQYVDFGTPITLDGHYSITPAKQSYTPGSGVYYNSTASALAYKKWDFNITGTLNGFSGTSSGTVFATGTYVDGVATLERTANTWATAHFYYNIADSEMIVNSGNSISDATCKIFEFDYKISNMITNDNRNAFRLDDNDYIKFCKNTDGTTLSLGAKDTAAITPGEWCNIRFEFYNVSDTKYVQIYVNDTYAYTQTLTSATNTYNNRIYFYLEAATSVGTTVCVDNLVMSYIVKDYVAK